MNDIILQLLKDVGVTQVLNLYGAFTSSVARACRRSLLVLVLVQFLIGLVVMATFSALLSTLLFFGFEQQSPFVISLMQGSVIIAISMILIFFMWYRSLFKFPVSSSEQVANKISEHIENQIQRLQDKKQSDDLAQETEDLKTQVSRLEESMILLSQAMQESLKKEKGDFSTQVDHDLKRKSQDEVQS